MCKDGLMSATPNQLPVRNFKFVVLTPEQQAKFQSFPVN